jgi:glycosyltransferase involved in cell wall biosynthesis
VYCLASPGSLLEDLADADVPVTCFGVRSQWNLAVILELARELRKFRPALLQTWLYHANIAGRLAGWMAGVPRVVSGIRVAERRGRTRLWIDRLTRSLVDHHVCVSRSVAEFSMGSSRLSPAKTSVIHNGVDFDRFAKEKPADLTAFEISEGNHIVLFVGRLDHQKAPHVLLDAFQQVEDSHLLFVGEGPLRVSLEKAAKDAGLVERVHFLGPRDDVPALMRAATCLVLPSRWEGLPNVILEAMAAGLPVVATDVDGSAELIENGETGFLVPSKSPSALGQAIEQIIRERDTANCVARAAQHVVSQEFAWQDTITAFDSLYESLIR